MIKLFLFLLSSLAIVQAGVLKENEKPCDGIIVNGVYHEKEILKDDIDRPFMLATDYATNTVYFSHTVNASSADSKTAKVNINTKEFSDLEGFQDSFTQTVDSKTHDVYVGTMHGINKYNPNAEIHDLIGNDDNIWYVYAKDGVIYYSEYPSYFLHTIKDGETTRYKDLEDIKVYYFVIDKDNDAFYTNATGLYCQKMGTKDAVLYKKFDEPKARGLTTDVNGNVYVCFEEGIYAVVKDKTSIELLLSVDQAFGVAFDSDNNIIYSDANQLVRLKPNKDKSC